MDDWYSRPASHIMKELESSWEGLTERAAKARLEDLGPNELAAPEGPGLFFRLLGQLKDPMILVLLGAAGLSLAASGGQDWLDGFIILVIVAVNAIISMGEYNRFSKGIYGWVGFKTKWFDYENIERVAGTTKWNFWGLFKYSIEGIVGFSTTPLLIAAGAGVLFCILAFIGILFVVVRALMFGDPTSGWPSMVCIILLCSGVQLFCTGIVGEYLAKTYLEVKHRPIYIVAETEENKK